MALPEIRHLIYVGCSDSRHVGFPDSRALKELRNPEVHVISNAGADVASGDVANFINKLVNTKAVRSRKEILVVATAHMNPACGGAHVNEKTVEKLKNDLKKLKFDLHGYLDSYEYWEKEVFSSVAPNHFTRAKIQADLLNVYGVNYVTGPYSLSESYFHPLFASETSLLATFLKKITGRTFEGEEKLLKQQKPGVLLLSVVGRHARLDETHQIPGKAFHVSIEVEGRKPTPKTVFSLIYYAHLNPGNAEVLLVGSENELKALRKFVNRDELLHHMTGSKRSKWKIKEKTAR